MVINIKDRLAVGVEIAVEVAGKMLSKLRSRRRPGLSPNFSAPYGRTQQDIDRIAAAGAKRARRALKKGSK